jgi:hypothetical protein
MAVMRVTTVGRAAVEFVGRPDVPGAPRLDPERRREARLGMALGFSIRAGPRAQLSDVKGR